MKAELGSYQDVTLVPEQGVLLITVRTRTIMRILSSFPTGSVFCSFPVPTPTYIQETRGQDG